MSIDLNNAFREAGLNAKYEGNPARILPVTADVLARFADENGQNPGKQLVAGDVVVTWMDNGRRSGRVVDIAANNDLSLMIRKSDGNDQEIAAGDMVSAIATLARMAVSDRKEREQLAEINAAAGTAHEAALARGEVTGAFEPRLPTYADNAFAGVAALGELAKQRLGREYSNPFTGVAGQSQTALDEFKLTKALRATLSRDEVGRVEEARSLRAEIAQLRANQRIERGEAAEVDHEDQAERMSGVRNALRLSGGGVSPAQMAAVMGNSELMALSMKPFTTLAPHQVRGQRLGPRDANTVLEKMDRYEDTDWGTQAIQNVRALLSDRMPGTAAGSYTFNAKLFSKDGVDMLLVGDQAGAALYMWDSSTRATEFNLQDHLQNPTLDDVPSVEAIEALRAQVTDLRYDNGADIDFGFAEDDAPGM